MEGFHRDREEASMKRCGLRNFVQTALFRAQKCIKKEILCNQGSYHSSPFREKWHTFGPQYPSHDFPDDTTHAVSFREMLSISNKKFFNLVKAIFRQLLIWWGDAA
jgi:hypothetical protein